MYCTWFTSTRHTLHLWTNTATYMCATQPLLNWTRPRHYLHFSGTLTSKPYKFVHNCSLFVCKMDMNHITVIIFHLTKTCIMVIISIHSPVLVSVFFFLFMNFYNFFSARVTWLGIKNLYHEHWNPEIIELTILDRVGDKKFYLIGDRAFKIWIA